MTGLSWKPQLNGEIYCSPACGGGCTKAAHDEARRRATELSNRMGEGWKPRVWENLGWHYCAVSPCKRIEVHFSKGGDPHYLAFLGEPGSHSGVWAASGDTPEVAVSKTIEAGKNYVAKLQAIIEGL